MPSNNKNIASRQQKFIESVEAIGDILVFETKRKKNKIVKKGLEKFENLIKSFLEIQEYQPDKFEKLLFSQEYFDVSRKNKEEAAFRLYFQSDKCLITFSNSINQLLRVHKAAIESKNDEISRYAVYHINWILAELSSKPNNDILIEELLKNLVEILRIAIKTQDISLHAALYHWYIDIVFNKLGQKDKYFDLSYLSLFDKYFFASIKFIVSESNFSLFKALVSTLVDGFIFPSYNKGKIWVYGTLLIDYNLKKYNELNIQSKITELDSSVDDLDTLENFNKWFNKFEKLKKILSPYFIGELKTQSDVLEKEINDYVISKYKYDKLLEIIFAIGPYCLLKEKPEFIKYMWEYKQPPDSDGVWSGENIIPNSINEIIKLYFVKGIYENKFEFWEDHRGSELYYQQYFLLLLLNSMRNITPDSNGEFVQFTSYNLTNIHVYRLNAIEHSTDRLIEISKKLKEQEEILRILRFDLTNIDELFDKKIIFFLQILKKKAQEQIKDIQRKQTINSKKVDEFKEKFVKSFHESAEIRNIFKYFNLYEDKTNEIAKMDKFCVRTVDEKAAFFEEWHVYFDDWGSSYGRNLALSEDRELLTKIITACRKSDNQELKPILDKISISDILMVFININPHIYLKNSANYKPKWINKNNQLDINCFNGWFSFKYKDLPVFVINNNAFKKHILILNKTKMGKIIQYSPLKEEEDIGFKKDIFNINIEDLSTNQNALEKIISEKSDWLSEIGTEEQQIEHLKEKALITIYEKFDYEKGDNFEGYNLDLN